MTKKAKDTINKSIPDREGKTYPAIIDGIEAHTYLLKVHNHGDLISSKNLFDLVLSQPPH